MKNKISKKSKMNYQKEKPKSIEIPNIDWDKIINENEIVCEKLVYKKKYTGIKWYIIYD